MRLLPTDFSINVMKKTILIFTLIFTFLGGFLFSTNIVSAQDDYGLSAIAGKADLKKSGDLPTLTGQLLGAVLSLIGIIFLLLMVYGGILWMTAHGNSQQTDKSLSIIISAVIGLIIVLGAYILVNFLFSAAGGGGAGSTDVCANPVAGLSGGAIDCTVNPEGCAALDPGLECNSNGICQATSDSFCTSKCGSDFTCTDSANCDSSAVSNYCAGGNNIVCCKAKQ